MLIFPFPAKPLMESIVNAAASTVVFVTKQRIKPANISPFNSGNYHFPCDPLLYKCFNCFPCDPIRSNFPDYLINLMERDLQRSEAMMLKDEYEALSTDKAASAVSLEKLGQVRSIRETVRATLAKNEIAVIKEAIDNLAML